MAYGFNDDKSKHTIKEGVLLWTNPNPNQGFNAQTIKIVGLMNYDFIQIEYKQAGGSDQIVQTVLPLSNVQWVASYTTQGTAFNSFTRKVITWSAALQFSACTSYSRYQGEDSFSTYSSTNLVPVHVYGCYR